MSAGSSPAGSRSVIRNPVDVGETRRTFGGTRRTSRRATFRVTNARRRDGCTVSPQTSIVEP